MSLALQLHVHVLRGKVFLISTSVNPSFKQGEASGEVVCAPCRTWYLLRMSLWCSAPPPPNPPPPHTPDLPWGDASEQGMCPGIEGSLGTPASWGVAFSRRLLGPGDFALGMVGPIGATVGVGYELQETFGEQISQKQEWSSRDENPKTSR